MPVAVALALAVALSTPRPAAPVEVRLVLTYEMTCGQPGPGPLVVDLPAAMHVPPAIPRAAVLVRGKPSPALAVHGHELTIGLPKPPPVTCMVIAPGTLRIVLTRAAGLRNPPSAGAYTVRARVRRYSFAGTFRIG